MIFSKAIPLAVFLVCFGFLHSSHADCPNGNNQSSIEVLGQEGEGYRLRITTQAIGSDGNPTGPATTNEVIENDHYLLSHLVLDQIASDSEITDEEFAQYREMFKTTISGYHNYAQQSILPQVLNLERTAETEAVRNQMRNVHTSLLIGPLGTISNVNDFIVYDRPEFNVQQLQKTARRLKEEFVRLEGIYQENFRDGHNYESAIAGNPGDQVDAENFIQSGECNQIALNQESLSRISGGSSATGPDGQAPAAPILPERDPVQDAIAGGDEQET
jgi:hypothetical protein